MERRLFLCEENGENIEGGFYMEELIPVSLPETFVINKVIGRKKSEERQLTECLIKITIHPIVRGWKKILKHKYVFVNAQLNSRLTATKRGRGNFYIARQTFLPQGYGIACPTGSPYKDVFSSVIIRLIEGGLVYKWAEDEVKKVAKNNSPSGGSRIAAINLHQLQAAFFILLMGFAISALVLGSEIIGNRARQNDIDTTLVHKVFNI
nr:glutamate receptor ionotropic, delta-2-like [Cherax quadricarinatus]